MEIETDYAARLFFPTSAFVQIYFEAVANAFDAHASEVFIRITSVPLTITISDNGKGFTKERFDRFAKLTKPVDNYHKGLGRLVYLKYFSSIHIDSIFEGGKRSFTFSNSFKGTAPLTKASPSEQQGTKLTFTGFTGERLHTKDDIKPAVLKDRLLEQFLPLLHNKKKSGQDFRIVIELDSRSINASESLFPDIQSITVEDVPNLKCKTFQDNIIGLFGKITMSYVLRTGSVAKSLMAVCIDGRTIPVPLLNVNAIPPDCSITFLFESDLFVGKSDSARQRFVLPDGITEASLYRMLRRQMAAVLNAELPEIEKKNASTKQQFEDRYPHLTGLFEEDTVGLIDKDEAIETAQRSFFKKQKEVLESDSLDDATFEKSLEVSSRTLTEYVLYREIIIKQLSAITAGDNEAKAHNLLVPQHRQFHGGALFDGIYNNNAWLLDDKFMSFRTILSEAKMKEVLAAITMKEDAVGEGRPDIAMVFSADPTQTAGVDVVIIEIKRRTTDTKNFHATTQLVERAMQLAKHYPTIQRMWYFAIIEIDQDQADLLTTLGYARLFSRGQHVFYREFPVSRADGVVVPTPVCLLSYDAVIKDAAARNHTFLEILKSAFKKAHPTSPKNVTS